MYRYVVSVMVFSLPFAPHAQVAAEEDKKRRGRKVCAGFGPQAPRDIDRRGGANRVLFAVAPPARRLKLCNVHFHKGAEHRARAFAIHDGPGRGYRCTAGERLRPAERAPVAEPVCAGERGGLEPGDTIEVHWVYTSCDVSPGPTLAACVSRACANPVLRVEAQVFVLVNDRRALDLTRLDDARRLPRRSGRPVVFLGSTTGPAYSETTCSPYQVTWSVRPRCAKLDIRSVAAWCRDNPYGERYAHGVRDLVTDPRLLSRIRRGRAPRAGPGR